MAEYYVDVSQTYNGDGSASTGAASAGATGAANNLITVLNGTHPYVSLVAGDTLHVRTGAQPTFKATLSAGLTTVAGAEDNPIAVLFDDGSIWGSPGTFVIDIGASHNLDIRDYTHWLGKGLRLIIEQTSATTSAGPVVWFRGGVVVDSVHVRNFNTSTPVNERHPVSFGGGTTYQYATRTVLRDCLFEKRDPPKGGDSLAVCYSDNRTCNAIFERCEFKTRTDESSSALIYMNGGNVGAFAHMVNCTWSQRHDNAPTLPDEQQTHLLLIDGLKVSGSLDTAFDGRESYFNANHPANRQSVINAQRLNGFGALYEDGYTRYDYRPGGNYPYRDATLYPSTGWSYRCYPRYATQYNPSAIGVINKQSTASDGTKTITLDLIVNEDYANVDDGHFWMTISYEDSSGNIHHETTRNLGTPAALSAGSGGWSATLYGSLSYDEYKLEHVTANAVKQNTLIGVQVYCAQQPPAINKFFFVDPSFEIS